MEECSVYFRKKEEEWENLCIRCGACCGAYQDPCKHLKKDSAGRYYCEVYENRFGPRETVNGEKFWCVPIKEVLHTWWPASHLCAYKKMNIFNIPK
jgi:uncharacterized cysteine cluster protein YcgN (CxxCxxCC family)